MPIERGPGTSQLRLSGEIDLGVADDLRAAGGVVAEGLGPGGRVEIDMAEVTFIDSSGLGALIAIRNAAGAVGATVALVNPSERVQRLLELSGLRDTFDQ